MKIYNLEDIKKLTKNNSSYIEDDANDVEKSYSIDDFDKAKTRILKYIFYKKRSENEVKKKFSKEYDEDLLEDIIENLKENGYINDDNYIDRTINEFIALKHLSIREIKYKLMAKGVNSSKIETYLEKNEEQLLEYEIQSAKHYVDKKRIQMEDFQIKRYLMKKGYKEESIKEAM